VPWLNRLLRRRARIDPGAQAALARNGFASAYLWLLIGVCGLLAYQAFVQANYVSKTSPHPNIWRLKILDVNNAITALVALLGLVSIRQQLLIGIRPILSYTGKVLRPDEWSLISPKPEDFAWRVTLRNVGMGPAIIRSVRYSVSTSDGVTNSLESHDDLIARLDTAGLTRRLEYEVQHVSAGAAIGSTESIVLFEGLQSVSRTIRSLDVCISFSGMLGEAFEKDVYCVPRRGFPPFTVSHSTTLGPSRLRRPRHLLRRSRSRASSRSLAPRVVTAGAGPTL
jgi:hypothetical protein